MDPLSFLVLALFGGMAAIFFYARRRAKRDIARDLYYGSTPAQDDEVLDEANEWLYYREGRPPEVRKPGDQPIESQSRASKEPA